MNFDLMTVYIFRALSSNRNSEELRQKGILDSTTIVTFSIKFYYTKEFAEVTDDIELYMDQVIILLSSVFLLIS